MKDNTEGYDQYTNKTINISVLTPNGWKSEVTIGGGYVITAPGSDGAQILVLSTPVGRLMGEGASGSATLEEYKIFRLSRMTREHIGPELEYSARESTLAENDAYEIQYSYRPEGDNRRWFVRETFTVATGKVYQIQSYARAEAESELQKTVETMKDSYRILD